MAVVSVEELRRFVVDVLTRAGLAEQDAGLAAEALLDADLRGVSSHGVALLERNVRKVRVGTAKARPEIRVVRDHGAVALLDGDGGLGPVVAPRAMRLAADKAASYGIGAVGVRNANHFGAAGFYATLAARRGMIGIATSNAAAIMAPPGGVTGVAGNSPIAVAVPGGGEGDLLVDLTISVVSYNKIRQAAQRGERIPLGWALDGRGEPTDDAKQALDGLLVPIGDYKGFALALVLDVLTGPLTGGFLPWEILARNHHGMGFFFQAIDPAAFLSPEEFRARVDALLHRIRSGERRAGTARILAPGERSAMTKRERLANGIPVDSLPWADLERLAAEFDVPPPARRSGPS